MAKVFCSLINDPYLNLALENELLRTKFKDGPILFLFKNRNCIVSGRFQNPWREINWRELNRRGFDFVRRQSGGGTVYHDMGNLNYSFIHEGRNTLQKENHEFVAKVLGDLGVLVHIGEKGDLQVDFKGQRRKISGSAFKQTKDSSFHHGTLLIDANLSGLHDLLIPTIPVMETRSISSRPFPVVNLGQLGPGLTIDKISQCLAERFAGQFGGEIEVIDNDHALCCASSSYLKEIKSWTWRIGETPIFEFNWDGTWRVEKGIVVKAPIAENIGLPFDQVAFLN